MAQVNSLTINGKDITEVIENKVLNSNTTNVSTTTTVIADNGGGSLVKVPLANIISSSETKTNDFFFGKPIYTKTIKFTTQINATTATTIFLAHGCPNVENIWVDVQNSFLYSGTYWWPVCIGYYIAGTDNITPYVDKTYLYFGSQGSWGTHWTKVITLRYTKTTD